MDFQSIVVEFSIIFVNLLWTTKPSGSIMAMILLLLSQKVVVISQPSLGDLLLEAPTLTDTELNAFENVRTWMDQWHTKQS